MPHHASFIKAGTSHPATVISLAKSNGLVPVDAYHPNTCTNLRYERPHNTFKKLFYPAGFPALAAVHLPTTDGRELLLRRRTGPNPEQQLLLIQ